MENGKNEGRMKEEKEGIPDGRINCANAGRP